MSDRPTHTPRCRCGAVMLGPGIAHCWGCHGEWPTIEEYNAHLLAVPRAGDMPDFRCRSVSSVVAVSKETLDIYGALMAGASEPSPLDLADMCGRLAYCCGELLKLVEDRETGLEKMMGVAYQKGRADERGESEVSHPVRNEDDR